MKIKKFAAGGAQYTPFITSNTGTTTSGKTSSGSATKSTNKEPNLQKEIIELLGENGLESDVAAFLQKADSVLASSSSLSSSILFGGTDPSYSMSQVVKLQQLVNSVKRNKEEYDEATQVLTSQGVWGEAAVTNTGELYVLNKDENQITSVSTSKYLENQDKYQPITFSQLMYYREKGMPFNMNVLHDATAAVGMKTIAEYIKSIVTAFEENDQTVYAHTKNKDSIYRGLMSLMNIQEGPEGYYKLSQSVTVDDENRAISFLMSNLSSDMKNRIKANATVSGVDPSTYLVEYLRTSLAEYNKTSMKPEFDAAATKVAAGDDDSKSTVEVPMLTKFATGSGEPDTVMIAPRSSDISHRGQAMTVGMNFGNMIGFDENTLPMMSVGALRNKAEYFKAAHNQNITFGDQVISPAEEHAVLWDGVSQVSQVLLPYKYDNGQITPDFDLFFRYQAYVADCDKNPNMTDLEKNELLKKHRLVGKVKPVEGSDILELADTMVFMTFSAYAHEDNINMTDGTMRMTEAVSKQEGEQISKLYENASQYGSTTPGKNDKNIYGFDSMNWITGDYKQFRKGNVFIPIKSSFLGTYASMKELIPKSKVNRFDVRSRLAQQGRPGLSGQFVE